MRALRSTASNVGGPRLGHGQELAHQALGALGGEDDLAGPVAARPVGPRIGLDHLRERHQGRERSVDVVDQPGHVLADRRQALDLDEMRARLADLVLERARRPPPGPRAPAPPRSGRPGPPARGAPRAAARNQAHPTTAPGGSAGWPRRSGSGARAMARDAWRSQAGAPVSGIPVIQAGWPRSRRRVSSSVKGSVVPSSAPWSSGPVSHPATAVRVRLLGRGREERQRLAGTERRREPRHHGPERPRRLGAGHERVDDRQKRLDGAGASLGALEEARLVDRERCRAGEQPEDGEVARGEAGPIREAVGVEDPHHPAADLERDRHGRLDAASLGDEVREPREVVALAQQDGAAGLGHPARHAFAQARSLLPRLGLAGRGARGGRHAQLVPLHQHQRGLVGAERVGGAVDDVAEQLVGGDLVREEAERQLLDPEDLVPALAPWAAGLRARGLPGPRPMPGTAVRPRGLTLASQPFSRSSNG